MLSNSTVLMTMYSIRSERAFCEPRNCDQMFKWFLDMRLGQPAFETKTFTKTANGCSPMKWPMRSLPPW
jgi:hypothetical protein